MPEQTTHPSPEELSAYSLGQLPQEKAAAIDSHISECEPCCETIVALASDDTFVGLLKEARQLQTGGTADETLDLDGMAGKSTTSSDDVPAALAEHPRYEIVGLIGKGGMGDVYKARHRMMDRTVALKVINRELMRKSEAVDRFHREVKTAAQLSHPNIVTSHDAEQASDVHFLVMEFVDGVDLSHVVEDRGPLPIAVACDYIRQAAIGLQHAHERGMVHRDIKPHNLMVTTDGTVKILDFGLASLAPEAVTDAGVVEAGGGLTAAGAIMGTPDFISPEQADDARSADIRSDIYSLGATLYFLLSGQPPFAEGSVMHKLKSHAQVEPEPLESLRDDVPPELVAVVTKMTSKDPEERYLTPSEVADALESFLRTWRPDDADSLGQVPSRGGHGSGSDGQKPGTGDARPDWLPAAAKWSFYFAWIPIALLMWELFFTDFTSDAADIRFWFYIGSAFCLSTIAGALGAAQRLKSDAERGDRRIFRMSASEALLVAGILIFAAAGAYKFYFSASDGYSMVSGGAGSSGDGWYVSAGSTYLKQDEPGVIFGMCENPVGDRSFSYIVLFRHEVNELTEVSSASNTGLQFDGETASIRDGLSIDGKGIELDLEMQMDRQEIQSSELVINGTVTDASRDRLFLVDLTSDGVTWNQVNAKFPHALLAPKDVVGDTYLVAKVARQITEQLANDNEQVRKFLAGATVEMPDHALTSEENNAVTAADPRERERELELLQGDWEVIAATEDGEKEFVADKDYSMQLQVKGNTLTRIGTTGTGPHAEKSERLWGRIELDSTTNPKSIDIISTGDPDDRFVGIYELKEGALKLCYVEQSDIDVKRDRPIKRPTTFDAPAGSKNVLFECRRVDKAPDLTQLQGDWDVIAFTQDGRKEFAADKGVGMLVRIEGETITRIQTAPNGEKSEKEWGRIEIDSTTNPKSIDIVNPDGPGGRLLGIYELKDGALKICFAERRDIDVAQGRPVKRPTKFSAPAGSDIVLLECRRAIKDPDLEQLQGEWELLKVQEGDRRKSVPPDNALVTVQGNRLLSHNGSLQIEIDGNQDPKTIDFYDQKGVLRLRGIYKFSDDRLIMILHEDGKLEAENPAYPKSFDPPADNDTILWELRKAPRNGESATTRTILDQRYKIIDGGKEIGSRHLVVTKNDQTLSIVEENSLELKFDGVPPGVVESDGSAVYSLAGDTPRIMRATISVKEQGSMVMHGTVEFNGKEALTRWTSFTDGGRKLQTPKKQQATLEPPPPGPLVMVSTIQVVGPLLLPEDGERKVVWARFNNRVRSGRPLVEYEAGWKLRRTSRPEGAGFTITVFEPGSDEPEMTWEYDSKGKCERVQLTRTTVMKPHEAAAEGGNAAAARIDTGGRLNLSPDLAKAFAQSGQSLAEFKKNLHTTISQAAGIPNDQWEEFATDPGASTAGIEGAPLSLVLLWLDPPSVSKENPEALKDFRLLTNGFPNPREFHEAMAPSQPHGYVSVIQPEYITNTNVDIESGRLRGSVEFEAPDLYAGRVDFAMEFKHGRMQIVEFKLPNYGIAIARDEKGVWRRGVAAVKQDTTATDLDRFQGDWEVIAAIEDGEKEFVADKDYSMQLQVEGNTLTRIGTTGTGPHAEKSERLWGRIELDSTTNPKSIDIISTDDPDDRFVGIYEFKEGALKLCYVEQSDIDVKRDRPVKRPTTFDAPAGSRKVLFECRRKLADAAEPGDADPMEQISALLDAWKKLPDDAKKSAEFAERVSSLQRDLFENLTPNTESHRQVSRRLALVCWPYLSDAIPKSMAKAISELTKPDTSVRISDRLAAAGRPTEPVGWDVQAVHALALARAGKTEEALKENETLIKKIDLNVRKGRLPDLQSEFMGKMRSKKSLLQQSLLQKALILAIAGRTAESVDASTAAGQVEVTKPTKDDQIAIQAIIQMLAKAAATPAAADRRNEPDAE